MTQSSLRQLLEKKDLLKIIVEAIAETIGKFSQSEVQSGRPFFKEPTDIGQVAVAGLIRFESKQLGVELFLGFSKDFFLNLYEAMFHMPADSINSENHDIAGEILNIAFGIMDPKLTELGYRFRSSFPRIYSGDELETTLKKIKAQAVVVPYTSEGRNFVIELYNANALEETWKFDVPESDVA